MVFPAVSSAFRTTGASAGTVPRDLQWLDAATLDLLEDLLTQTDLQHLLLIGAYRDNEVHATHPLVPKLDAIAEAERLCKTLSLTPLRRDDLSNCSWIPALRAGAASTRWRTTDSRKTRGTVSSQSSSFSRWPDEGC